MSKSKKLTLIITVVVIVLLIAYLFDNNKLITYLRSLSYITSILGLGSFIFALYKYTESKKIDKFHYAMEIIGQIQKEINPILISNEYDKDLNISKRYVSREIVNMLYKKYVDFCNHQHEHSLSKERYFKVLRPTIKNFLNDIHSDVMHDAITRVIGSKIIKLEYLSIYVTNGYVEESLAKHELSHQLKTFCSHHQSTINNLKKRNQPLDHLSRLMDYWS